MKIKTSSFFVVISFCLFLLGIHSIFAQDAASTQEQTPINIEELITQNTKQGELAMCSDYFKFNSVNVDVTTDFQKYDAGQPLIIRGTVKNTSSRLITNFTLKARLIKDIPEANQETSEFMVLDEFDIIANKVLATNQQLDIAESYILPLNAPTGEYKILLYAVEDNAFDLSGVYFSNDITATTLNFAVEGGEFDHIYLDQTQIMIDGESYNTSNSDASSFDKDAVVTIPLYNPSDEPKEMNVTYNVFAWDSKDSTKILDTQSEKVLVPAKSEKVLSYLLKKSETPVSYISIIAEPSEQEQDTSVFKEKTIANVRLTTVADPFSKLAYVGVTSYPLENGKESTLVTCLTNTSGQSGQSISKIETILYDADKKEIARTEYNGEVFQELSALIQKFKPSKDMSHFSIESRIYNSKNTLIDSFVKEYSCEDIDPSLCQAKRQPLSLPVLVALGGLLLALVVLVFKRKEINSFKV